MQPFINLLKRCVESHTFDTGDPDCETVLDQMYRAYAQSHEVDPLGIRDGFKELESFGDVLPQDDNNEVCNLCCHLCSQSFSNHLCDCLGWVIAVYMVSLYSMTAGIIET